MAELTTGDVYNLAAAGFDLPQLGYLARASQRLVELADLRHGQAVLDVGCGTGSSALLAARRVALPEPVRAPGAPGSVLGLDLADQMIERARQKAAAESLSNAFFETADLMTWPGTRSFDVVLGAFCLFLFPDSKAAVDRIAAWTRHPGRWGFTFWGEGFLLEWKALLRAGVAEFVADYIAPPSRADLYSTPEKIQALLSAPGRQVRIVSEHLRWPLASVDDWWTIVRHSGERKYIEAVPPEHREEFRRRHLEQVRQRYPGSFALELDVHYALVDVQ